MIEMEADSSWTSSGYINGWYLAGLVSQSARDMLGGQTPLTISTPELDAARGGDRVLAETEVLKLGRFSTVRVRLRRGEAALVGARVVLGSPSSSLNGVVTPDPPQGHLPGRHV